MSMTNTKFPGPLPFPFVLTQAQMLRYTQQYKGERFPDGRPKVPDAILERMKSVTCEQAWTVLREQGYHCQFQGKWVVTHQNPVLVGRAVTCNFIPYRPDVADVVVAEAQGRGLEGRDKHWVMDQLVQNDVLVADLQDKQIGGGFIGDNLANMIYKQLLSIWSTGLAQGCDRTSSNSRITCLQQIAQSRNTLVFSDLTEPNHRFGLCLYNTK